MQSKHMPTLNRAQDWLICKSGKIDEIYMKSNGNLRGYRHNLYKKYFRNYYFLILAWLISLPVRRQTLKRKKNEAYAKSANSQWSGVDNIAFRITVNLAWHITKAENDNDLTKAAATWLTVCAWVAAGVTGRSSCSGAPSGGTGVVVNRSITYAQRTY